ncbi:Switch-associated protein 70 [Nymphon striatum]|nr:Switch-associated protein 70 [Nymphon striatum]
MAEEESEISSDSIDISSDLSDFSDDDNLTEPEEVDKTQKFGVLPYQFEPEYDEAEAVPEANIVQVDGLGDNDSRRLVDLKFCDHINMFRGGESSCQDDTKVFTASIGTLLGYNGAENGLKEHRSTPHLNFDDYLFYVNKELLCFSPGSLDLKDVKKYQAQIEELSWLVCRKALLKRDFVAFADQSVFQLFRIFCMLGELVQVDNNHSEVVMVADEVEHVTKLFMEAVGQTNWDSADFSQIAQVLPTFRFSVFLALLETRYANCIEVSGLTEATREVHDMLVEDVIKKGYLSKKMMLVGKMRERWFVLQPSSCIDTTSKNHFFQLINGDKKFEFGAHDYKSKHQWITALKMSLKLSSNKESYQKTLAQKRKAERESILHKKIEERNDHQSKQHLNDTEKLRIEAEEKADAELKLRLKGEKGYLDLQESYSELEKLLEDQKKATKDEEIVRALQARMLTEEWDKREKLEQIQKEQQQLIETETESRTKLSRRKQKK